MTSVQQLAEQEAFQSASLSILFNRLTTVATWSCLTYSGLMLFIDGDPMRILATMIIAIGGPLSNLLRRTTNTRWGFSVYLWSIFLAISAQSALRGGLANPVLHANVVLILMGGWLLGFRQAMLLLLAAVAWIGLLTLAGQYQWWAAPVPSASGLGYWFSMTSVWVIGYLVMRLVLGAYRQGVTDVMALDAALREKIDALTAQEQATRIHENKVTQVLMASPLPITVATFSNGIQLESFPGPLGQVLMNLVTNAVTHAFDGRNNGRIQVSATMTGLSELALGQIVDPFFTTRLGQGGSGLGLSISHRIVTKVLGGQIAVSSALGQGARFELNLPINAPSFVH